MRKYITFLVVLSGLCWVTLHDNFVYVNKEFESYLDRFKTYAYEHHKEVDVSKTSIYFGNVDKTLIGQCLPESNTILIDRKTWDKATDSFKERTIFHELGHCIFHLKHDERITQVIHENMVYIVPVSIMYHSSNELDWLYDNNKEHYLNELFR